MRIVLASNAMGRGGAEMQVKDYAVRLVSRGHDVLVVSMLPFEDFEEELRSKGVATATLGMTKGRASTQAFLELVRVLRSFRADVLHAHMFAAILAARAARAALEPFRLLGERPPVVIGTAHTPFESKRGRYLAYRFSQPFSDLWTCVCREGVETHERHGAVPAGCGVLTANGIDVESFAPDSASRASKRRELGHDGDFLWLTAGSFRDEQKDYGNLLRAFARVANEQPDARLLIAGAGALFEAKKRLAGDLGIAHRVEFLGLRSDMTALMHAADAFVLGSAWEAMPIVLLEAAASGLPMVVTDVGQNSDIVVSGTGFVVPLKDHVELADAMLRVGSLSDDERHAMGARARGHVSGAYDLDVIVGSWERRYRELLARGGGVAA